MICVVDPFTGLAGDMLLGALLDAGADLEVVRAAVAATGLTGWELRADAVLVHGLRATKVSVEVTDEADERSAGELIGLARQTRPLAVADVAVRTLRAIAEVEGRLHGQDPASVHLHELGGHDTVVDVVGVAAALHFLNVSEVFCGPLPMGTGSVGTAHGRLPVPAPATAALLTGARVIGSALPGETVTPTAAALLVGVGARYDAPPPMTLSATGYGAGTRVLADRPNVCVARLGLPVAASTPAAPARTEPMIVLETNLDDVTGEVLGHLVGAVLAAGAADAWLTPAIMKKGRPAQVLHVLTIPELAEAMADLVFAETGTLGIRRSAVHRTAVPRRVTQVEVDGCPIRIKHGPWAAKAEHDDVVAAATRLGRPLREIADRAMRAAADANDHGRQPIR